MNEPLTREEMLGFCSIVFAGGRDTVINSISGIIGHLSMKPADFDFLRADPKTLCERVGRIDTLAAQEKYEEETRYRRRLAYETLTVRVVPR